MSDPYRPGVRFSGDTSKDTAAPITTGRQNSVPIGGEDTTSGDKPSIASRAYTRFQRLPGGGIQVAVPNGVPRFLGARPVIFWAWVAAMAMVSWDEWNSHHILPRPARLWYTSLTYFLLALLATADAAVPLATALAIGFTVVLTMQYYTGNGQFTKPVKNPQVGSPTTSTNTGTGTVPVVNPTGSGGTGANPTGPGKTGGGAPGVPAA